jgi:hypothetical protein
MVLQKTILIIDQLDQLIINKDHNNCKIIIIIANSIDMVVFIVMLSPKYNQVIIGKVIIDVANPRNLIDHREPKPSYPHLVANQNK